MTKFFKAALLLMGLFAASTIKADEFRIERFTIAAGETKTVTLYLDGSRDYINFQLDIYLPEGITIEENSRGIPNWKINLEMQTEVGDHAISGNKLDDTKGHYRIIVKSDYNYAFKSQKGNIVDLPLVASDQVLTGEQVIKLTNQTLTDKSLTGHKFDDKDCPCEVQINTTVSSLEFASFSWPRALDFTDTGVKVYIAKDSKNGSVKLEEVKKVPANTGVILNGNQGTCHPQTTDVTDDVSGNLLTGTAKGAYKIDADNVYVLSNLDNGKPGLYRANVGVTVKQYKAYMVLSGSQDAKDAYSFDFTTDGIEAIDFSQVSTDNSDASAIYSINGQRVRITSKGIYVSGGKKYVVR